MPPITNAATAVIGAWTALEVLSPQSFKKPQHLAIGSDPRLIADFSAGNLPWELGDRGRQNKRLFYHVVLGTLDAPGAFHALLETFADTRAERPKIAGEIILASVLVDKLGVPTGDDPVALSSFAWGLPIAMAGDLTALADWTLMAERIKRMLRDQLQRRDKDGEAVPLTVSTIQSAYAALISELRLPPELVRAPRFAVRQFQDFRLREPPDPLLLNSFYLGDLARARTAIASGQAPRALRLYMSHEAPATRHDLLNDSTVLAGAVAPSAMPLARWPVPGRHPLVLLQQAAVNLAVKEAAEPGVLAVNGPPGTGKTTLLRDVVAALISKRAEAMARFDDPSQAFKDSGKRVRFGTESASLFKVDASLRGFEMIVASSNNKAVENVSVELPSVTAVAGDAGLSYFRALSDALLGRPTWGLVAAVLGNAGNRTKFRTTFWWDADLSLSTYLSEAAGTPQWIEEPSSDGSRKRRKPKIIAEGDAPTSRADALARWKVAREQYRQHHERSNAALSQLEEIRQAATHLSRLKQSAHSLADQVAAATSQLARLEKAVAEADNAFRLATSNRVRAEAELVDHDALRPSFAARLFRTAMARQWLSVREPLADRVKREGDDHERSKASLDAVSGQLHTARSELARLTAAADQTARAASAAEKKVAEGRDRLGNQFVDDNFFARTHEARHQTVPWCDAAAHRVRDELFVAAVRLHKAFIDASANAVKGNLAALMKSMGSSGGNAFAEDKAALLADLWSTLFLVVPVLSTTFASVERMFGDLPAESLGWLLVDEAGQALPQAAVGAILRTRRSVVVGDPVQIEPVVPLPERLTQAICRRFGVDPNRFNAPEASAQTLADAATPYMAEFHGRHGSRTVGVPLLVHRRCSDPMFGIANAVAYQHLMVQAKQPRPSAIRDLLGPSRWVHVQGRGREKWCAEEGDVVVEMLRGLVAAGVAPNLYVVSPFRSVAEHLTQRLVESGVLNSGVPDPREWVSEHVGTVHTVQGREAEAVFFVIGAPEAEHEGARRWAGKQPNLLNVALTRAQEVVYVVGNRDLWRSAGVFSELHSGLPA